MANCSAIVLVPNPQPEINDYLGYTLRYPGGVEVTVSRSEFEKRKQADAPQAALQWVFDIAGLVRTEGNERWFSQRDDTDDVALLLASQIVSVDLSGCMLAGESLSQLAHLENLQSLDLSNTPLASLQFLPRLEHLTALTLRHLPLKLLSTLKHTDTLRHLDLSHSPFDSSIATTVLTARNLQTLKLAHTNVDRFLLDDLSELSNLTEFDVQRTRIRPAEIAKFSQSHPAISVRSSP